MPGILPDSTSGGVVVRNAVGLPTNPPSVLNAYVPAATFTSTCNLTALPSNCNARFSPAQINAIVSELLCFAEGLDPNGEWDCTSLCNLRTAFTSWAAANAVTPSVIAAVFKKCDGTDHAPGDQIPTCAEMAAAIAAALAALPPVGGSADAGNLIAAGSDGGPFLDAAAIVAGIAADDASADALASTMISGSAGNDLTIGADGRLYLDVQAAETTTTLAYTPSTKVLAYTDEDGNVTSLDLSALAADIYVTGGSYNPATMVLTLTDNSGATPDITVDLSTMLGVSTNAGNLLANGTDNKPMLNAAAISALASVPLVDAFGVAIGHIFP